MDWSGLNVLVTGGTGSFGQKFTEIMVREFTPRKLVIFSRDELKQHEMRTGGFDHPSLRYFIGDVRDVDRLRRAMTGMDIVVLPDGFRYASNTNPQWLTVNELKQMVEHFL